MTSSTESKIKSKYDSSSKKIQQLYQEFSAMRKIINTPSKRQRDQVYSNTSVEKKQRQLFGNSIDISIPRGPRIKEINKNEGLTPLSFQTQTFIKNACMKSITCCFVQMDKKLDYRIGIMQNRLNNLGELFSQLATFYKIKFQNLKSAQLVKCKCTETQKIIKQVQSKYNSKIKQLIEIHQNKISLLLKQNNYQETSDSSNPKKSQNKQLEDELHQLQDKLIVKQKEITTLKLQNCKLRRATDQLKQLINGSKSLVNELTNEVADKQLKIDQLSRFHIQKIVSQQRACSYCEELKTQIINQKKQNQKIKLNNQKLQNQIQKLKRQIIGEKQQHIQDELKLRNEWNQYQIQKQELVNSENEEDQEVAHNIKNNVDFQPLRHTQYYHTNQRKNSYRSEQKIKELQSQLQLVVQQNKLLKVKKDKFEQQVKQNEGDQQKFQMQCQILRDQMKNLNAELRLLDQCSVIYLKQKKIPEQKINKLSHSIKFRQQYFKKYPKTKVRSQSKA